jgi:hypothetical protein
MDIIDKIRLSNSGKLLNGFLRFTPLLQTAKAARSGKWQSPSRGDKHHAATLQAIPSTKRY